MGELILCSHPIAAMPYYIDNISLNVYSLEELCYYIENHLYLIEADFMSEELCLWIGQNLMKKIWHSRCAVFCSEMGVFLILRN